MVTWLHFVRNGHITPCFRCKFYERSRVENLERTIPGDSIDVLTEPQRLVGWHAHQGSFQEAKYEENIGERLFERENFKTFDGHNRQEWIHVNFHYKTSVNWWSGGRERGMHRYFKWRCQPTKQLNLNQQAQTGHQRDLESSVKENQTGVRRTITKRASKVATRDRCVTFVVIFVRHTRSSWRRQTNLTTES